MKKLYLLILVLTLTLFAGCRHTESYDEVSDIAHSTIGILRGNVSEESIAAVFPDAEIIIYDKPISLLLDIESDKCDVAIMGHSAAHQLLSSRRDYGLLGEFAVEDSTSMLSVVLPQSMIVLEDGEAMEGIGWWENMSSRIYNSLFSDVAWRLIVGGLYATAIIFIFAAIFSILLGGSLAYMGINHRLQWLYRPLNWFVLTIHDVPSVVLMMFFYYVIFAGRMDGIIVSIIALGVYTSGSLAKIFKIHIQQVGKEQMEAGRMLGLTSRQCYRYIIMPQAVKAMLPLFIAELKLQLRATSYAGYIAQKDLVKAVDDIRGLTLDTFVPLLIVSALYLLLSWLIARVIHLLYEKFFDHD